MFKITYLFPYFLVLELALASPSEAMEVLRGKVVGVSDGDTITLLLHGTTRKIRLLGIDCPEKSQAFGQKAKEFTSRHAINREVKVLASGQDRYKRTLGEVILPDGQNLNELLLDNGYAWWYRKYSKDGHKQALEEEARIERRGLWSQASPAAPWEFRKAH